MAYANDIKCLRATFYKNQAKSSNLGTSAEIDFLHILPFDSPLTAWNRDVV